MKPDLLILTSCLLIVYFVSIEATSAPNIIMIVADDMVCVIVILLNVRG